MLRLCSLFILILFAAPLWAAQSEISGIARVIDADTLEIGGKRIRLGGIDAPEMSEQCRDAHGTAWRCGIWATEKAKALIANERLSCADLGERTHDRVVGRCFLRGRDLAIVLIEAGAARPCLRHARAQGQERAYVQAERVAMRAGAGIYAGPLNPPAGFCEVGAPVRQAAQITAPDPNCVIKGNVSANGRIYHIPGQRDYERVTMRGRDTRWFCSAAEAQAAGWRPAQR